MYIGIYVKYPSLVSDVMKIEFSRQSFEKNTQLSIFMEIRPIGAELLFADRQSDNIWT